MAESKRALLVVLVVALLSACGPTNKNAHRKSKDSAVLLVQCPIKDAEIWLNSRYFRNAGEFTRGVRLRPGAYRIEVRHSDFHSMYYEVDLAPKQRKVLEVALAPRFP